MVYGNLLFVGIYFKSGIIVIVDVEVVFVVDVNIGWFNFVSGLLGVGVIEV